MATRVPHIFINDVEHKKCSKCPEVKPLNEFYNTRQDCKTCHKKWRDENNKKKPYLKQKRAKKAKERYQNDSEYREKIKTTERDKWHNDTAHREKGLKRNRERYQNDPEERERKNKRERDRYQNDDEYRERQLKMKTKRYHTDEDYRQERIAWQVAYEREQLDINPFFKWKHSLRSRQRKWLKGKDKSSTSEIMMGCTWKEGYKHIESLFKEGMTWDNHGEWHTDHIIPLKAFEKIEERHYATWYKNLQPMWGPENMSKSDKYEEEDKLKLINEYLNSV